MSTARFITDFADQAVVLPVVAAVAAALAWRRQWRSALAWVSVMGAVLGTMLVLKVLCHVGAWHVPAFDPDRLDLRSPSGHAAAAAAMAGGIAACLAPRRWAVALGVAAAAAILVGWTRVSLGAHSPAEVLVGSLVGMAGAWAVAVTSRTPRQASVPVLLAVGCATLLFHGRHLPAEAVIQREGASLLCDLLEVCPAPPGRTGARSKPGTAFMPVATAPQAG